MSVEQYVGTELELFAEAHHWKSYFSKFIGPHLGANVLEVGAGMGGTTAILTRGHVGRWSCLEPDSALAGKIGDAIVSGALPCTCTVSTATLADMPENELYDSILYIDVLEHIEDDAAELHRAASRLNARGKLIILSPAYQWLYSEFDKAIGHFRRYDKQSLQNVIPKCLERVELRYLDSIGLLASAGNRFVTRSPSPSAAQIRLWDRVMVPMSQFLDPITAHSFGKSVFGVWEKPSLESVSPCAQVDLE